MRTDEEWMKEALREAEKAREINEVPVGAVIVRDHQIIAKAHNLREQNQQAAAHAELLAIRRASEFVHTWNLEDCDLYVTLEPCMMCTGAIGLSRIRNLYYGTADPKGGCIDSLLQIKNMKHIGVYPKTIWADILQKDCAQILTDFFAEKRKKTKERTAVAK